jgi:hypothetical protein
MVSTIERRLLVNYRVAPEALAPLLPEPFRPQVVHGVGIAGICFIRLGHIRPARLPAVVGVTTENAAHRIAVEWDGAEGIERGVYIPRRDTSSRITAIAGGRLFPGEHHRARFEVREADGHYAVAFTSLDGTAHAAAKARRVATLPDGSAFPSLTELSDFFQHAPIGYSATRSGEHLDGVELACSSWRIEPLLVEDVESSFFDDPALFEPGVAQFDSALLMHDLPASWHGHPPLTTARTTAA